MTFGLAMHKGSHPLAVFWVSCHVQRMFIFAFIHLYDAVEGSAACACHLHGDVAGVRGA